MILDIYNVIEQIYLFILLYDFTSKNLCLLIRTFSKLFLSSFVKLLSHYKKLTKLIYKYNDPILCYVN